MTVRVHELAKQLDISSKELIQRLEHIGVAVKNNLSAVSDEDAQKVKKNYGKQLDPAVGTPDSKSGKKESQDQRAPLNKGDVKKAKEQIQDNKQERQTENKEERKTQGDQVLQKRHPNPIGESAEQSSGQRSPGEALQRNQTDSTQRYPQSPQSQDERTQEELRGNRPQGARPQGEKFQGNRPQGARNQGFQGARPQGGFQGDRPQGARPQGERFQGNRPQGARTQGFQGDRPQGARPQGGGQGDRPQGARPQGGFQGDRAQGARPQGRSQGDRPQAQRSQGGVGQNRPYNERSGGERTVGQRPYGDRSQGAGRPQGNRPASPGDRSGDRPGYQGQGQRSYGDRPQGGSRFQGGRPGGQGQGQRPQPGQGQRFDDRSSNQGGRARPQRPNESTGRGPQPGRGQDRKAPTMQKIKIDGKTAELSVAEQPAKRQVPNKKKAQDSRTFVKTKKTERDISALTRRDRQKGVRDHKAPVSSTPKHIIIPETISVQEFASRMSRKAGEVIKTLMTLGVMATINQEIDSDTAVVVGNELGVTVEVRAEKPLTIIEDVADDPADLRPRPPVVTVMGHVDHGKTSLLDAIRSTNVIASEAGGITQHIGAYQVEIKEQKITFLDTPGHEAFTAMRARGAQVTDVAVLVVAADDGIMPQTVEAINHAKAANVPIVVAINKIDKEGANPERVKQELTEQGLVVEEWGGETIAVAVSAKARLNIESLLEMILLVAEMKELKANPFRKAMGTVIEAKLDKGKGPVATVLVDKGTLMVGDVIIAGPVVGKIRAMVDDKSRRVKKVPPGTPVEIQGLSEVPEAGEIFHVVEDERLARQVASARVNERKAETMKQRSRINLDDLFDRIKEGEVKELNIIIKGDVQGSVEAIRQSLCKLSTSEVRVNPIHGGVGAISENDVMLAAASNAIILGFNVRPDTNTKEIAGLQGVDIRLYRVIYDAINDVRAAMEGLLEPEYKEVSEGRAEVRQVFKVPKIGAVAGSYVTEGKINRSSQVRLIRDGIVVFEGDIDSLRRFKDDVKTVMEGYECGIGLKNYNDIKEGDIIEAYTQEEIQREL